MKIPFRMLEVTVISVDVSGMLFALNSRGVPVHFVRQLDDLTARFCIPQSQCRFLFETVKQCSGRIERIIPASSILLLKSVLRRPVLIICGMLLLVMTLYIPTRIFFVKVSGNERVSSRRIIETATSGGVFFGAARHELRSETVKNRLLTVLPDLKWVGVNTAGCVAHISVQERAPSDNMAVQSTLTNIVASCDGVIREITTVKGTPVCKVGQAVTKGQLLVSGYADCGRCIYTTHAEAEVYAQTIRRLRASTLNTGVRKTVKMASTKKIGLILGKKRINFFKGSGISDVTCVRMYMEYPLTLPGGFELPIVLTVQEEIAYETAPLKLESQVVERVLTGFAKSYLDSQMIAGRVVQEKYQMLASGCTQYLEGQYICIEMIGLTQSEEIVKDYEQTD